MPATRTAVDRDEVLRRVNLVGLLEARCPPPHQRTSGHSWPCPVHTGQTGKSPPVTVTIGDDGHERWRCWSCGAGGTAIDLVMALDGVEFREALEALAGGAGGDAMAPQVGWRPSRRTYLEELHPEGRKHLVECRDRLWRPEGHPARSWLRARGLLDEAVLRANGIGFDPGGSAVNLDGSHADKRPWGLQRLDGLPKFRGVTFPVLDSDGKVVTYQSRNLRPDADLRWWTVSGTAGPERPPLSFVAGSAAEAAPVVICEGLTDGLSAAIAGLRPWAVLGTSGGADRRLPDAIAVAWERSGRPQLCLCGDNDGGGRTFTTNLQPQLDALGVPSHVIVPPTAGHDLNDWYRSVGAAQLRAEVEAQCCGDVAAGPALDL